MSSLNRPHAEAHTDCVHRQAYTQPAHSHARERACKRGHASAHAADVDQRLRLRPRALVRTRTDVVGMRDHAQSRSRMPCVPLQHSHTRTSARSYADSSAARMNTRRHTRAQDIRIEERKQTSAQVGVCERMSARRGRRGANEGEEGGARRKRGRKETQ
eukprot:6188215-Pleurochrysis_carterae.AAC.4